MIILHEHNISEQTLKILFMAMATLRRAWSEVSTTIVSEMKSGPSIRQMVISVPATLGLPAIHSKVGRRGGGGGGGEREKRK